MLKNVALARHRPRAKPAWDLTPPARIHRARRARPALSGPLLVDAGDPSLVGGALRMAEALARRDRVGARVLTVVPPLPSLLSVGASLAADLNRSELDEFRREAARKRTRVLVSETVGASSFFSTSATLGRAFREIGEAARAAGSAYVLSGLAPAGTPARHAAADRLSRLATQAGVPVVAVPSDGTLLPRSAFAAIDLSEASLAAARAAVPLLAEEASLTLAHVLPAVELVPPGHQGSVEVRIQGAMRVLRCLADDIQAVSDIPVHLAVLQGEPAAVLSQWQSRFDLVTLGASRRAKGRVDASANVSAAALRVARGAVLVAPAPGASTMGRTSHSADQAGAENGLAGKEAARCG